MYARPPAKVNLTLAVGPVGADGYHPLRSVFVRIGLADVLTVAPAEGNRQDGLTVAGLPGCPVDGNLVLRAFQLVRRAVGHDLPPLVAHLEKHVPLGAGLGGGSSDGAAAIEAASAAWGVALTPARLAGLGFELGADVPFFARGGAVALVEGRGEHVRPLPAIQGDLGMLLVTPRIEMSTAAVFGRYDELGAGPSMRDATTTELADAIAARLTGDELCNWAERLRRANDLWPAAASLEPVLASLRNQLEAHTGRPWLLSGSGSTLFALYPSAANAADAGRSVLVGLSDAVQGAIINAVDLLGPDPAWRYP